MQKEYSFNVLGSSDLVVDALYKGGKNGNSGDDPISKLMLCENQGGFRKRGTTNPFNLNYVILYSDMSDLDWVDTIDEVNGLFTYFGDNKKTGHKLHETRKKGNLILRDCFTLLHLGKRKELPPFFVFTKGNEGRDVVFRGLAVPGAENFTQYEDLVAVWKSKYGVRFQNYKAIFTILDVGSIDRAWIEDLSRGDVFTENCPVGYKNWVSTGKYSPLKAEKSIEIRKKKEQLPVSKNDKGMINEINAYFKNNPYGFEVCACKIAMLMDKNIISCDITRKSKDGGRDAIGKYAIGSKDNAIVVEFALEAKCYNDKNPVGVRETSRLISRLRNRQFGIIVTTSYIGKQAYTEIKEDGHPVLIIAANDIIEILKNIGVASTNETRKWLKMNFSI